MNQAKSVFLTLLVGLLVLAGLDIVFNQGQTIAALVPDRTAVSLPQLDTQNLVNQVPDPRIVLDTSAPATVVHSNPQIVTATPGAPAVVLESLDTSPTPTAEFAPTPEFSPGFLAACAGGMARGERVSPRCPSNAAEMLGTGR